LCSICYLDGSGYIEFSRWCSSTNTDIASYEGSSSWTYGSSISNRESSISCDESCSHPERFVPISTDPGTVCHVPPSSVGLRVPTGISIGSDPSSCSIETSASTVYVGSATGDISFCPYSSSDSRLRHSIVHEECLVLESCFGFSSDVRMCPCHTVEISWSSTIC
jgi:hypothetical protein